MVCSHYGVESDWLIFQFGLYINSLIVIKLHSSETIYHLRIRMLPPSQFSHLYRKLCKRYRPELLGFHCQQCDFKKLIWTDGNLLKGECGKCPGSRFLNQANRRKAASLWLNVRLKMWVLASVLFHGMPIVFTFFNPIPRDDSSQGTYTRIY